MMGLMVHGSGVVVGGSVAVVIAAVALLLLGYALARVFSAEIEQLNAKRFLLATAGATAGALLVYVVPQCGWWSIFYGC